MKKAASFFDTSGRLYVDCTECERGANGKKDCSSGWRHKKANRGGCFLGELLPGVQAGDNV